MKNPDRNYSTCPHKMELVALIIALAALIAMICLNVFVKRGPEPDAVFQMTNRKIEWTGAGYSGIYGR